MMLAKVVTVKVEVVKVVPPPVGQNRCPETIACSGAVVGGVIPGRIIVAASDGALLRPRRVSSPASLVLVTPRLTQSTATVRVTMRPIFCTLRDRGQVHSEAVSRLPPADIYNIESGLFVDCHGRRMFEAPRFRALSPEAH